jgi:2-polyprenyl-6-methoxyphenol hydroxylase-like FAD-dependent oxidoreductase
MGDGRAAAVVGAGITACGPERVRFGKRLAGLDGEELRFEDGGSARADLIVGADGLGSVVRRELLGDGEPRDAGIVAYRGVAEFAGEIPAGEWWGAGASPGCCRCRAAASTGTSAPVARMGPASSTG